MDRIEGLPALYAADGVAARHSSETNEHYTPAHIVHAARRTMGRIECDPASSAKANEIVGAHLYFDVETNGFVREWRGTVFLNPPGGRCDDRGVSVVADKTRGSGFYYAGGAGSRCDRPVQSSAKAWWFKLAREVAAGNVCEAVFVGFTVEILQTTQVDTPAGLSIPLDWDLCFPRARVKYVRGSDGQVGASPPHASVIVHLGSAQDNFRREFSPIGRVLRGLKGT